MSAAFTSRGVNIWQAHCRTSEDGLATNVFDVMVLAGGDVMREPLEKRRELLGQFEFLEWTGDNHLRHSRFVGLREDKNARDVVRE